MDVIILNHLENTLVLLNGIRDKKPKIFNILNSFGPSTNHVKSGGRWGRSLRKAKLNSRLKYFYVEI